MLWGLSLQDVSSLSSWVDLSIHVAMLQTLVPGHLNQINPSFWSLAVEVQLYLLYPLIWMSMRRWGSLRTVLVCAAFSLTWRFVTPIFWRDSWWISLPWRWGYEWILGVGVAATQQYKLRIGGWSLLALGAGATAIMLLSRSATQHDVFAPLLFALTVHWVVSRTVEFPAPLAALGGVSYAFYLVHQPVLGAVAKSLSIGGETGSNTGLFLAGCLIGFGLSVAIAVPLERFGRSVINALK